MSNNIKYWKGEEELTRDPKFLAASKHEFEGALPLDEVLSEDGFELDSNRRDFLKFFGFSVTAVALAACYRTPVRNAVPYLVKPQEVTPGIAQYYSSTCGACAVGCGIEVKVREGRPIKLDGNPRSAISRGALCAAGQAGILGLYDTERLANPLMNGAEQQNWNRLDVEINKRISAIAAANGRIVILSNTIHSPSTLKAIEEFSTKFPGTEHVMYDAVSYSGMLEANQSDFGKATVPSYDFEKAQVVVSFGADFLGTWVSPVEFTKQWVSNRVPQKGKAMSKHIHFESNLSITGSNADDRFPMKASKEALYLTTLHNYIAGGAGGRQIPVAQTAELAGNSIKQAAQALLNAKGASLVISGSNDRNVQHIVNGINMMLGNYGTTIDINAGSNQYKGNDTKVRAVLADLNSGKIGGIIFYGTNPAYNHDIKGWESGIKKAKLSISFAGTKDETAGLCQFVCPDHHYLESWSDSEPKAGQYHFSQPTISPVFNTRQAQLSLLSWAGAVPMGEVDPFADKNILSQKHTASPYYLYLKNFWAGKVEGGDFNQMLHDGVYNGPATEGGAPAYEGNVTLLADAIGKSGNATGTDLILYTSVGMQDGNSGNNPWMYELPDPVSKVTWDNYVSLPKAMASKLGIEENDTVDLEFNGVRLSNVPALVQPGQANDTVGLALGFGRWAAGKVGGSREKEFDTVGFNAYPFMGQERRRVISGVKVSKGSDTYVLAQTQTHHSIEGRDLVREATYEAWQKKSNAGNDKPHPHIYTIWEKPEYRKDGAPNHFWAMAIDLNACTGCGSCVISCHIENNVPVVGRNEVRKRREMHWLRIDRYYSFTNTDKKQFEGEFLTREKQIGKLDDAQGEKGEFEHYENVRVIHQPMLCQHCGNAPCETVCPVLATTHSSEGLNQMTYNRCIGTKYCGNNCPYKVRRFNWFRFNDNDNFDFHFNNPLGKMVINPDVTVRTRGVMEKCSFCVQRIQESKLKAKRENRGKDTVTVETACQRACPANAIVFGDLHNPESEVSKLARNERGFTVLEELNVKPSITYLTKIRNTANV